MSIDLTLSVAATLKELRHRTGSNTSDVIARALALLNVALKKQATGRRVPLIGWSSDTLASLSDESSPKPKRAVNDASSPELNQARGQKSGERTNFTAGDKQKRFDFYDRRRRLDDLESDSELIRNEPAV